jgi:hypothetical protein
MSNVISKNTSGISQLLPGTLSLIAQVRRSGASAALLILLHISSPECCTHSVREGEEDAGNGDELQQDGWDTKATYVLADMKRNVGWKRLTWRMQRDASRQTGPSPASSSA